MGMKIDSIGIYEDNNRKERLTFNLIKKACDVCFGASRIKPVDIDVLIHVSIYRSNEFVEPAMASFIQRDVGIVHGKSISDRKTLSFDLVNGSLGFLQACQTISAMAESNRIKTGLVVSGNSKLLLGEIAGPIQAYKEIGTALSLEYDETEESGFSSFYFRSFSEYFPDYEYYVEHRDKRWVSTININPDIENIYSAIMSQGFKEYLTQNKRNLSWYDFIVPPQVSSRFVSRASEMLGIANNKLVNVADNEEDLMSASETVGLDYLIDTGAAKPGTKVLVCNVGSGLQYGCATYTF